MPLRITKMVKLILETFETLIVNYLRSQRNTIDKNTPQKLENLAIYVTDKDGLLVLIQEDLPWVQICVRLMRLSLL